MCTCALSHLWSCPQIIIHKFMEYIIGSGFNTFLPVQYSSSLGAHTLNNKRDKKPCVLMSHPSNWCLLTAVKPVTRYTILFEGVIWETSLVVSDCTAGFLMDKKIQKHNRD